VTGILHIANQTPIDWFSKKQVTVETATYGSEFVAARTCTEQIMDLRNTFLQDQARRFQGAVSGRWEPMPHDMPRPRGRPVTTTEFVDASHASSKKTRKSHTGYLLFVNRAPIFWYSKRQQTVELSTFSSEFIALKAGVECAAYM
jgi:hypothetical protein